MAFNGFIKGQGFSSQSQNYFLIWFHPPNEARISVASGREEEERDLRAASCPVGSSPKGVPYSS
eukprot:19770-Heterococcus_DN1.PRE.1